MVEGGNPPIELDYELNSKGPNRFNGTLDGPFTAHPKYYLATGELHSMNYHWPDLIDHVNYTVVGGDGRVTKNLAIPVNDMPMMHDMSLTEKYVVIYDLSVTVNFDVLGAGYSFPFKWDPDRPGRVRAAPATAPRRTWSGVTSTRATCSTPSTCTTQATGRSSSTCVATTRSWSTTAWAPSATTWRHSTAG